MKIVIQFDVDPAVAQIIFHARKAARVASDCCRDATEFAELPEDQDYLTATEQECEETQRALATLLAEHLCINDLQIRSGAAS